MDGQARAIRAGRRLEDQARRVQSSIPRIQGIGVFYLGAGQFGWQRENSPSPDPCRLGKPGRGFFPGVLAPLLIHGALAALVPVIGSAIHRRQGRQDFFCGHYHLTEALFRVETTV